MPRLLMLIAGTALSALVLAPPAQADTSTAEGDRLVIVTGSADVIIDTDASLAHSVRVQSEKDGCANVTGNQTVSVETAGCDEDGDVTVTVPPGFPVTLTTAGGGTVHMTGRFGLVAATIASHGDLSIGTANGLVLGVHGSGNVTAETVNGPAEVDGTGSGDVHINTLNGPLKLQLRGSGNFSNDSVQAPAVEYVSDGSGDGTFGPGHINVLKAHLNGTGDLTVAATVDVADVGASGGGDVKIAKVTGPFTRRASGGSTISTGVTSAGIAASLENLPGELKDSGLVIKTSDERHGEHHIFAGVIVLVLIIMLVRTLQKNNVIDRVATRFTAPGAPPPPSHPGVIAVRDAMARLEARLGRVEGYVTTREFDLQRKFRDLDRTSGPS